MKSQHTACFEREISKGAVTVTNVFVSEGQIIDADQKLFEYKSTENQKGWYKSPYRGKVVSLLFEEGSRIEPGVDLFIVEAAFFECGFCDEYPVSFGNISDSQFKKKQQDIYDGKFSPICHRCRSLKPSERLPRKDLTNADEVKRLKGSGEYIEDFATRIQSTKSKAILGSLALILSIYIFYPKELIKVEPENVTHCINNPESCEGQLLAVKNLNLKSIDDSDKHYELTLRYGPSNKIFSYPKDFQSDIKAEYINSVDVTGVVVDPVLCIGKCIYLEDADVVIHKKSDEEIAQIKAEKFLKDRAGDVYVKCIPEAERRTLSGNLNCSTLFADYTYRDTPKGLYVSFSCDGVNGFGAPKKFSVRCKEIDGQVSVDYIN